jgi:anhydro-N-acetylmuramic acid kinase
MMSGTSLDGVDAAAVLTDGQQIYDFGPSTYRAYTEDERAVLHAALGLWPGEDPGLEDAALRVVMGAHREAAEAVDGYAIVGFHGQTLAHDPDQGRTHQLGDGTWLAKALGKPVIWDFRTADMVAGGQGAPLAPFYHHACARWAGLKGPIAFLNLGGVGNLTWLDADAPPEACLAFDTGPANAPLDDLMQARLGQRFDADGAMARQGRVEVELVAEVLAAPFYAQSPPKSLDRSAFAGIARKLAGLDTEDAAATLVAILAGSVAHALALCPASPQAVYVCGGGRKNPAIMEELAKALACPVAMVEELGLDGDMLEAQAFAYLAVRVARGLPLSAPGTTGVPEPMPGGRISRP